MYTAHPSRELNALFEHKPFQGARPESAKYLFVGLDANYDAQVEQNKVFSAIKDYHSDGVAFWRHHGVHHPFLLPQYSGDGLFYHRSFARIGFGQQHADLVSFIELLHVPTVGRSSLVPADLAPAHLSRLNSAMLDGAAEHIFIPAGVARLMHATKAFRWLSRTSLATVGPLNVLFQRGGKTVYSHLHFSVYGKFEQRKSEEAIAIRSLLPKGD